MDALKKATAMLDPTSPLGQAVLKALKEIGSKVGAAPPETQANNLQSQLIEAKRSAMQRLAMQQMQQQGGAQAAAPGGAPPGAAQAAPPPQSAMAA
jgi:hypothetical protein